MKAGEMRVGRRVEGGGCEVRGRVFEGGCFKEE